MKCKYVRKMERMKLGRYSRYFTERFAGYADRVLDEADGKRQRACDAKVKEVQMNAKQAHFCGFMNATILYLAIGMLWIFAEAAGVLS